MPGHPITKYEDTPISGLPVNVPNGICGLDGAGQVAAAQLGLAVLDTDVGVAGGVAGLDGSAMVPLAQLPAGTPGGLATLDGGGQVPVGQLGNVPSLFGAVASLVKTDGNLVLGVTGLGVFVDLPGLNSVSFTPSAAGTALVLISGTGGVGVLTNQGLALNVNGVDLYPASVAFPPTFYGGDPGTPGMNGFSTDGTGGGGMAHTISMAVPIAVLAVLTTVKIRISIATGFAGPGFVAANATCPLFLTVLYK